MKAIKWICMALVVITACKKPMNSADILVKLTDAPAAYEAVNIDLQKVMVHYQNAAEDKWVELRSKPGIYNLLDLRNNVTVVIADDDRLPAGKISQIRLVLGNNNTVVNNGIRYELQIPSSNTSGLKINMHETVRRNDNIIVTLDFDAESSVNLTGSGQYIMNPVITVKSVENN